MKLVAAKVFLWLQLLDHTHAIFSFLDYNVSNPVCSWDNETNTCGNDADAMIDLLTRSGYKTGHTFADLMRCELATAESVCNGLTTCIWENDACRVSAAVLLDTISSCYGQNSSSVRKCQKQLQTVGNSTTWIDRSSVKSIPECESTVGEFPVYCETSYRYFFFSYEYCFYSNPTCALVETALECSRDSLDCVQGNSEYLGYKLLSDIRYIMGLSGSSYVLTTSVMEEKLDVRSGNLALYNNCGRLNKNETCETKLEVPPPPKKSPTPTPYPYPTSTRSLLQQQDSSRSSARLGFIGIPLPILFICCLCAICRKAAQDDSSRAVPVELSGPAVGVGTTTGTPEAAVGASAAVAALEATNNAKGDDGKQDSDAGAVLHVLR